LKIRAELSAGCRRMREQWTGRDMTHAVRGLVLSPTGLPAHEKRKRHHPAAARAPGAASRFRITDGIRMTTTEMLVLSAGAATRLPEGVV